MLVLTRKSGEDILIGDNIRVRVLQNNGGRVRLGIIAPKDVSVVRLEKYCPDGQPMTPRPPREC